jgi:putative oxidoreductase
MHKGASEVCPQISEFLLFDSCSARLAAHATQKLFGGFGGHGLKGTSAFFGQLGFQPGIPFLAAAGLSETGGGVLLALGLLTPLGSAGVLASMIVAIFSVHVRNGFFAMENWIELPFLYAASAFALAFSGAGRYSLDTLFGLSFLGDTALVSTVLLLSAAGAGLTLDMRKKEQKATALGVENVGR